jgi:hypothetical protein
MSSTPTRRHCFLYISWQISQGEIKLLLDVSITPWRYIVGVDVKLQPSAENWCGKSAPRFISLSLGKKPQYPMDMRLNWSQSGPERIAEEFFFNEGYTCFLLLFIVLCVTSFAFRSPRFYQSNSKNYKLKLWSCTLFSFLYSSLSCSILG